MLRSSIAAEKGIVKVIHPGRYVEILKEPITAGEVMRKNPRHCLTRPDVFKFPWIVIKPDSVLPLGKVFLLVPNRTLYDLMKSEQHRLQPGPPHRENRINATTKNKSPRQSRHNPSLNCKEPNYNSSEKELCGEGHVATPYWMDSRNTYEEFRRYLAAEGESGSDLGGYDSTPRDDHHDYCDHRRGVDGRVLKPCLKKAERDRRSVGLRVRFAAPLMTGRSGKERQSSTDYMLRNRFDNLRIS